MQEVGLAVNRPKDTPFRQQRLKACQPILTPFVVITVFVVLGVIMFPLGFIMWHFNEGVVQVELRYDHLCTQPSATNPPFNGIPCTVTLDVQRNIPGPAYFYYKLTNFYQNHRRYVSSRSDPQLAGQPPLAIGGPADCTPLQANGTTAISQIYMPCGLVANSWFTDRFSLTTAQGTAVPWARTDISWPSDRQRKFQNMSASFLTQNPDAIGTLLPGLQGYASPGSQFNVEDEDFIVWMRVAGLPVFRKLYARLPNGLPAGRYTVNIANKYSTAIFGNGTKSIVVSNTSFIGGYNTFLGYAYIAVGSLCLALALVFFVVNLVKPRKLGDPSLLSWNREGSAVIN